MRKIFIIILIVSFFTNAYSQVKVFGIVKNNNNEYLIGANIYCIELNKITSSNENGYYSIHLPYGNHILKFSFIGYDTIIKQLNLSEKNNKIELNINLKQSGFTTNTININAKKNHSDINSNIEQINLNQIKEIPQLFGDSDPIRALQLKPGIQNTGDVFTGLHVRGGDSGENLILLDNAHIFNPNHLLGFYSVFNGDAIQKLELYKSGMPTKFGGHLSSILDIKLKEGNYDSIVLFSNIGILSSKVQIEIPIIRSKLSLLSSYRRTYIDYTIKPILRSFENSSNSFFYNSTYYFEDFSSKLSYRLKSNNFITLSIFMGKDDFSLKKNNKNLFNNKIYWTNNALSLNWINYGKKSKTILSSSYSNYNFRFDLNQTPYIFNMLSEIQKIKTSFNYDIKMTKNYSAYAGYEIEHSNFSPNQKKLNTNTNSYNFNDNKNLYTINQSLFLGNKLELNNRVILNLNCRLSKFNFIGPYIYYNKNEYKIITDTLIYNRNKTVAKYIKPEFRANIKYLISDNSNICLSYDQNYQYEHLVAVNSISFPSDFWIPSTQNILPEFSEQFSLDLSKSFNYNKLSSSVYYKNYSNQLYFIDGIFGSYYSVNIDDQIVYGNAKSYGFEISFNNNTGKLHYDINYAYSRTLKIFPEINEGEKFFAKYDRPHDFNLFVKYQLSKNIYISSLFVYASGNRATVPISKYFIQGNVLNEYSKVNAFKFPDYNRLDLSIGYKKTKKKFEYEWIFSIYNVYNKLNPFYIYYEVSGDIDKLYLNISAKQVSLFPVLPSISFNFRY